MMPKQLTIFDVEVVVAFDPKKAHIHRLNSKLRYTDLVVQILRQAKAIDGLKPKINMQCCIFILGFNPLRERKNI